MPLICDIHVGRMWMCSKTSCYYKIRGGGGSFGEKNISVAKIIVRHVERGFGNGRQMYADKKPVNCSLCQGELYNF